MNLPNYFLADLPPEATLTGPMIFEACRTLKQNRERYLAHRTTAQMIQVLTSTAKNWLDPDYPFRRMAIERGPAETGFSRGTLLAGLDPFFRQLTPENFQALVQQELGHQQRLDRLVSAPEDEKLGRAGLAVPPELVAHLAGGSVPVPTLVNITLGVLLRSAQVVKCSPGTSLLPRLFAHSLYEAEPKLGACLEIIEWRGTATELEDALFAEAECVTASGPEQALENIRRRLPENKRFVPTPQKVSFGYISNRVLTTFSTSRLIGRAATDVVAWNQLGSLAPHVFYIEHGGEVSPTQFAERLASELDAREEIEPRGTLPPEIAGAITSRRSVYQLRAAHSTDTRLWCSRESTNWTVVYETEPRFQTSCLNRFVYVKGVKDLEETLHSADPVKGRVSTVGVAAPEDMLPEVAATFTRWGAARVCPIGQMQRPSLASRHTGRPALADLVQFSDWEM